jgi:hypothetical protein
MTAQQIEEAHEAGSSPVLPAGKVIALVREWVERYASQLPDFGGAYLWGGITALPVDAPFALYRDVDVVVILPQGAQDDTVEVHYEGLSLEVIRLDLADHQDAAAVLANPSQGPNMAATQILADPLGILVPLQRAVAAQFSDPRWVQARCNAEKTDAERALADMRSAAAPADRLNAARSFLGALSGLMAVARLERPTTRRTLTLLGDLLDRHGQPDLHEAALEVMGCDRMSPAEVQAMLARFLTAYDRAVEVRRTPTPYGFAIRAHLRPYHLDGTQEMIDEGHHREAVFWITCLDEAYLVLHNDAPAPEKPVFDAQLGAMYEALGYISDEAWAERVKIAERLAGEVYACARDVA